MEQTIRNRKIYLLSAAVLLTTFVLGAFTGAGIVVTFTHPMGPPPMPPERGGPMFHPLPLRELHLSDAQRDQVMKIMEENRSKLDAVFEETFPKLRKATRTIEAEIRKVLTDEQKRLFDKMIEQRDKMDDQRGPHPVRPPM